MVDIIRSVFKKGLGRIRTARVANCNSADEIGEIRTDCPAGEKTMDGGPNKPPPRQDLKSGGTDQCETGDQSQGVGRLRGTENGNG